jgi:hypothetical protein
MPARSTATIERESEYYRKECLPDPPPLVHECIRVLSVCVY